MCSTVIASLEICLTSLVKNIILSLLSNYLKSKEVSVSEIAQLCPTLCDLMDCSLLGSSVHGIFQAIILEWIAISSPEDLPDLGIKPPAPELADRSFTTKSPGTPT